LSQQSWAARPLSMATSMRLEGRRAGFWVAGVLDIRRRARSAPAGVLAWRRARRAELSTLGADQLQELTTGLTIG
jgi:hypothetical protein